MTLDEILDLDVPTRPNGESEGDASAANTDEDVATVEQLLSEVAQALIGDDARVRPGRKIGNQSPSSSVEALLGHLGRGGRTGRRAAAGASTGRRAIGPGARRGGRAIYAGHAAANGNAAALAELGLRFSDLEGRPWYEQVLLITDTIIGSSSNADEDALRNAVVDVLMGMGEPGAVGKAGEALRDVVAAYVCELAVVELTAALTARDITEEQAADLEDQVRQYIDVRRDSITVPPNAVHGVTDFEDAAELLTQEVLLILRTGGRQT